MGRLYLIQNWLRKSTFALPELLPVTANSHVKNARLYKALGGYHLRVRGLCVCWQGVP